MKKLILALFMALAPSVAFADSSSQRNPCYSTQASNPNCVSVSTSNPLPITGNTNVLTYSSAIVNQAYTVAGDVYCVGGSDTKTVKVKGIRASATATAATSGDISIILRSSADSGGGAASVPIVKMDQSNPSSTASVTSFTSAPTAGTTIGTIRSRKISAGSQGNNTAPISEGLFQFSVYWDQPVVLRGASQFVCVNTSALGAGATFDIDHEHTEE